jgi:hypothetical protein
MVRLGILGAVLLAIGVLGFVVTGAVSDDYETEEQLLETKGVDADQATADLQAATDAVEAANTAFRDSVEAAVAANNALAAGLSCDPLTNPFGCTPPSEEEVRNELIPAADAYAAAVDAEQNALAQLGQAVAALQAALQ